QVRIVTCFQEGVHRLRGSEEGIYFGGTRLLEVFMDAAVRERGGRLWLISPYVDEALFASPFCLLSGLDHVAFSVTAITSTDQAARSIAARIGGWQWGSFRALWHPRLHGKMYLLRATSRSHIALIGSHNLTV